MNIMDDMVAEIAELKEVDSVCVADHTGAYITGVNQDTPEEFAAILTFIGQAGQHIGESLGLEDMVSCTINSRKLDMVICSANDHLIGTQLTDKAVPTQAETRVSAIVSEFLLDEN
mgnify:CR=1 FL=1